VGAPDRSSHDVDRQVGPQIFAALDPLPARRSRVRTAPSATDGTVDRP
jgi:hypothetical protein